MALPLPHGRLKASETIEFPLDIVHIPPHNPRPVVLILAHTGRGNAAFTNAEAKEPAAPSTGSPAEQASADDLRAAKLHSKYGGIVGWKNVASAYDAATDTETPVEYTPELGEEVLRFLIIDEQRPDFMRAIRFVCRDPDRFTKKLVDPGEVGKR